MADAPAPRGVTVRKLLGAACLAVSGISLALTLILIPWAIMECGPVNSSCHHPPYRLAAVLAFALVMAGVGAWLALGPRRGR